VHYRNSTITCGSDDPSDAARTAHVRHGRGADLSELLRALRIDGISAGRGMGLGVRFRSTDKRTLGQVQRVPR
jgi:hypothetical protein